MNNVKEANLKRCNKITATLDTALDEYIGHNDLELAAIAWRKGVTAYRKTADGAALRERLYALDDAVVEAETDEINLYSVKMAMWSLAKALRPTMTVYRRS